MYIKLKYLGSRQKVYIKCALNLTLGRNKSAAPAQGSRQGYLKRVARLGAAPLRSADSLRYNHGYNHGYNPDYNHRTKHQEYTALDTGSNSGTYTQRNTHTTP